MMDGPPAGAAVPICSPFGQTLYPQFNLSGPQITPCNRTKEAGAGEGCGDGRRAQWLPEEPGLGRGATGLGC